MLFALNVSICYFFFWPYNEQSNLATTFCVILHQFFAIHPQLLQHALLSWEKNRNKIQHEVDELWCILIIATVDLNSPHTIYVLDALDECQDNNQKQLIQKLKDFYTQTMALERQQVGP